MPRRGLRRAVVSVVIASRAIVSIAIVSIGEARGATRLRFREGGWEAHPGLAPTALVRFREGGWSAYPPIDLPAPKCLPVYPHPGARSERPEARRGCGGGVPPRRGGEHRVARGQHPRRHVQEVEGGPRRRAARTRRGRAALRGAAGGRRGRPGREGRRRWCAGRGRAASGAAARRGAERQHRHRQYCRAHFGGWGTVILKTIPFNRTEH